MEACGSAHYWAKTLIAMGLRVVLIAPQHVKPFRLGKRMIAMMHKQYAQQLDNQ